MTHFSTLVPKHLLPQSVLIGPTLSNSTNAPKFVPYLMSHVDPNAGVAPPLKMNVVEKPFIKFEDGEMTVVPLLWLCFGRSGDKGDTSNIGKSASCYTYFRHFYIRTFKKNSGIIARKPEYYSYLRHFLTEERVFKYMKHLIKGRVKRYELPGCFTLNFVCTRSLGKMIKLLN
jgi:hypothetical protein